MTREEILKKAKPILFNTDMVRAIMDGRKTVTRRVVKPQPTYNKSDGFSWRGYAYGTDIHQTIKGASYNFLCAAPFKVGDILYVRETWCKGLERYLYKANYSNNEKFYKDGKEIDMKWKPSIHMQKEAARIFLKVTDVRVERLQEITEEHAQKEGCQGTFVGDGSCIGSGWDVSPVDEFSKLWNSTSKKSDLDRYGWDANPWVWVIDFEKMGVE